MTAVVVQLRQRAPSSQTWSNQELAEFYRVTEILSQAGIAVGLDSGVTDEGDPWQVFYREDTGDILVHFAKIDDQFVIACPPTGEVQRGTDMRGMIMSMLGRQPSFKSLASRVKGNVHLHPAMVLCTFVVIVYLLAVDASEARAAESAPSNPASAQPSLPADGHASEGGSATFAAPQSAPAMPARKTETSTMEERYTAVMTAVMAAAAFILDAPHTEELPTSVLPERPTKDNSTSAPLVFTTTAQDLSRPFEVEGRAQSMQAERVPVLDQGPTVLALAPETIHVSTDAKLPSSPQSDEAFILLSTKPPLISRDAGGTGTTLLNEYGAGNPHAPETVLTLAVPSAPITIKIPTGDAVLVIALERVAAQPVLNVHNAVEINFHIVSPAALARYDVVASTEHQDVQHQDAPAPQTDAKAHDAPAQTDAKPVAHAGAAGPAETPQAQKADSAPTVFSVEHPNTKAVLLKGAEVVVYSGGNVTLYNFEMGVDKLIIDADVVDTSRMVAKWSAPDELVIDFGGGKFVKMVGIVTEHAPS